MAINIKKKLQLVTGQSKLESVKIEANLEAVTEKIKENFGKKAIIVTWQFNCVKWGQYQAGEILFSDNEEWNINLCHEVRIFDEGKELHLMKDGKMLVGRLVVDGIGKNVSYVDSIAPMWGYATESEKGFTRLQDEPRKLEMTVPANIVKGKRCGLVTRNYVVSDDESGLSGYGDYRYLGLQELEV